MRRKTQYGEVEQRTVEVQEWLITPEIAREILKRNTNNRSLSKVRVQSYEIDMKNDKWEQDNPQNSIVISEDGELKDGQHRLTALVKSGVSLWFKVFITNETCLFDKGKSRNFRDNAKISGLADRYTDPATIGAARFLFSMSGSKYHRVKCLPDSVIREILDKNGDNWEAARISANTGTNHGKVKRSSVIAALYCASVYGVPEHVIARFCKVANSGFPSGEYEYSAIAFTKNLKIGHSSALDSAEEFNACQEAIQDFVNGKKRTRAYPGENPIYYNAVREKI